MSRDPASTGPMDKPPIPSPVRHCLRALGRDIRLARKRRRFSVQDFAARLQVGKGTVTRLERGDPGVSIKTLAMAFLTLGEIDRLRDVLDSATDGTGLLLADEQLPQRIRSAKKKPGGKPAAGRGIDLEGVGF